MGLSEAQIQGLGVALNEADWLGIAVDEASHRVALGFRVLTLPADVEADGPAAPVVVTVRLRGVTRIAASLRHGLWNDPDATIERFELSVLPDVVASFGGLPIYGWEFIDPPESDWVHWRNRLSLDVRVMPHDAAHVIDIFQAGGGGPTRHLDLRVWFDELTIQDASSNVIALQDFIDGGVRWWDAMYAGDPRTEGQGIYPAGHDPSATPQIDVT